MLETYGAMGPGAEAWFRGCIAVAELQRPEWVEEDEEMGHINPKRGGVPLRKVLDMVGQSLPPKLHFVHPKLGGPS